MKVSDLDEKEDITSYLLIKDGDDEYKLMKGVKGDNDIRMLPVDFETSSSVPDNVIEPHSTKYNYDIYPMKHGNETFWVTWDEFQSEYGHFEIIGPSSMA